MLDAILAHFPAHVHPLTLVCDPDGLLADEPVATALAARGFRLLAEADPVALRHALAHLPPPSSESPLVVVTAADLATLPYDLWQQGHPVRLELHRFFPRLDYPTLRQLTPEQRRRLAAAYAQTPPLSSLSLGGTVDYLLAHVFAVDLARLAQPGPFLLWLADHHARPDPLPPALAAALLTRLARLPVYQSWPLADLLADPAAFAAFVQTGWTATARHLICESPEPYRTGAAPFADDPSLQTALPELVRRGLITPVGVDRIPSAPAWSSAGLVVDPAAAAQATLTAALDALQSLLAKGPTRWETWQELAQRWAAITLPRVANASLPESLVARTAALHAALNTAFAVWLSTGYSSLALSALPEPHHLYHVPTFLAHRRGDRPLALLVLDGMSLAAWLQIRTAWQPRHPTWRFEERLLLAQIPSVTSVSRQALLSGKPPRHFAATLATTQHEPAGWQRFWQDQGLAPSAIAYTHSPARVDRPFPPALADHRTRALALVLSDVDDRVHAAAQGLAQLHHDLDLWLSPTAGPQGSVWLEQLVDQLLAQNYLVALTSDHGHTEAVGVGQPNQGVLVTSRAKRARLYQSQAFAAAAHQAFPESHLWYDDGVLPPSWWAVLPAARQAFATPGALVVSHGGLTLEELVVPLVLLRSA